MELSLGRKRFAYKTRVSRGLCLADVNRPVQRQWQLFEHGLIEPLTIALAPKLWMADVLFLDPDPITLAPETLVVVRAFMNELEKLAVSDLVDVDRECRRLNRMNLKLVVPAKRFTASRNPECYSASRDVNHPRSGRPAGLPGLKRTIA